MIKHWNQFIRDKYVNKSPLDKNRLGFLEMLKTHLEQQWVTWIYAYHRSFFFSVMVVGLACSGHSSVPNY